MVMSSLGGKQARAVESLVEGRRIEPVPPDRRRAQAFLAAAEERLSQCELITSPIVRYGVAYDACHDVGEAFLGYYGFRTTNRSGQHEALGRFLRAVLPDPPGNHAARRFDRLRKSRNQAHYQAVAVGAADADLAVATADALLSAARQKLLV